jgi:acyl carrier protein
MDKIEAPILSYLAKAVADTGTSLPITRQTGLLDAGLLDSIGLIGLVQFLEAEFGLQIPERDLSPELFETPASIVDYVSRRMAVA